MRLNNPIKEYPNPKHSSRAASTETVDNSNTPLPRSWTPSGPPEVKNTIKNPSNPTAVTEKPPTLPPISATRIVRLSFLVTKAAFVVRTFP